jgi:hypothetical protein
VTAVDWFDETAGRLLRLQRALCRLPVAPTGLGRHAALLTDPVVRLSDLVERLLVASAPAMVSEELADGAAVGLDRLTVPGSPMTATPPSVPPPGPRPQPAGREPPGTARPGGRRRHAEGRRGDQPATVSPRSAAPIRPAPVAVPIPASALDLDAPATSPAAGAALPVAAGSAGQGRSDTGAATHNGPPAGPGIAPTAATPDGQPPPAPIRRQAGEGRTPSGPRSLPPSAFTLPEPAEDEQAPPGGAAPGPPGGVRLAQSLGELAAALQSNLGRAIPPQVVGGSPPPGPDPVGPSPPGDEADHPAAGAVPEAAPASDPQRLLEWLARELELQLIRVYGTSGR